MTALRRVEVRDEELLDRQNTGPEDAGDQNWFGYRSAERSKRGRERLGNAGEGGTLAIVDDSDTCVGEVQWTTVHNGPPPNGDCWNLGIWIAPEYRGRGHGSASQHLAVAYLFAHTMVERVEAGTEADNIGEQRALEKAGFTREGVLRHACFRDGSYRDMVIYSVLRGEQ